MRRTVRAINKYARALTQNAFTAWGNAAAEAATEHDASSLSGLQQDSQELQSIVRRHIALATSQESVISNLRERLSNADGEFLKAVSAKQAEIARLQGFAATDAQQLKRLQRKMVEDSGTIRELRRSMDQLRCEKKQLEEQAMASTGGEGGGGGDCESDLVGRCAVLRSSLAALSRGTSAEQA